jgi:short-subunit dehydrogenase involved in D-alanine esterification of teichoic acids
MTTITNATVLITGGASGIGLLLGTQLLARGAKQFIIWDINQAAINNVVAELIAKGH